MKIIECVPNFSEGRNMEVINKITSAIETVSGISMLDIDPGADTNRTVVTFVGEPQDVIDAAFEGIKKASELIDMREHSGEHARMGATDVCPFVPVSGVTIEECIEYSKILAKRVGEELSIPVFLYEHSATADDRHNLATVRAGEYEGMDEKLQDPHWAPDFGPSKLNVTSGVTAIGCRNFLIAYNFNLNTQSTKIATDIALDIREAGRNKRNKKGKFVRDDNGIPLKQPGTLKGTKAVGWFIEEYDVAQVSMNIVDHHQTPTHIAFEEVRQQARKRGVRVTGSELVGLIPLESMLDAGRFYLQQQKRSTGIPESDIIHIAIKSMGLDELAPFNPNEKIIEYRINPKYGTLAQMKIYEFADELSSESMAPGGGSVAALAGSMGAGLSAMVANLTFGKKKWDSVFNEMTKLADKGQKYKTRLLQLIDEDTDSFNSIIDAIRLPKNTDEQIIFRNNAIEDANKHATNIPFNVAEICAKTMDLAILAAKKGNQNSISDAGVAAEMASAGARGAVMNVKINIAGIDDKEYCEVMRNKSNGLIESVDMKLAEIRRIVSEKLGD
jgi:glutamate formiminotransferase / formiminotetrahydrofolate cyclodeaminase